MEEGFVADEIFEQFINNKYLLVNVAAYRARQLNDGVEVYVKSKSRHPLQIALEEIAGGHIQYVLGAGETETEETDVTEEVFRFDDIIDLEGDFDMDDEGAFDFEDIDFEDEFADAEDYSE